MNRAAKEGQRQSNELAKAERTLGQSASSMHQARAQSSRDFLRTIREEDRAWENHARTVERSMSRISRASGGGGGGRRGGMFSGLGGNLNSANFLGTDLGRAGIRPRTIGFGALGAGAIGLIKPLENILGLAGAIPAAMGAAGIAITSFHAIGSKAILKAAADQAKANEKFKQGTITAKAYHNAMKNALVGLSDAQKGALPFFVQWHDVVLRVAETIQKRMLPALRDLGAGIKSNKASIVGAFGAGSTSMAGAITGIGTFMQSRQGKSGVGALASSSANLLGGFSSASVNLFKSFLDVARAAAPLVNLLSKDMTRVSAQFAAWTGSFKGQQAMKKFFLDARTSAGEFLHVLGNLGMAVHNIGGGVGTGFLDWLVQITQRFKEWTSNQQNVDKLSAALKRVADTLLVIGGAIGSALPKFAALADFMTRTLGPNTLGWLLIGKSLGGGKLAGKIGGGLIDSVLSRGAGAAGGAAAGAGGAAVGGAAVGIGAGTLAAVAGVAAALVGLGGVIVYLSLKTGDLSESWKRVEGSAKKAAAAVAAVGAANATQRGRQQTLDRLTGQVPSAKLGLFDAKDRLAADQSALAGLKGKDKQRMLIQIEVDTQSVKDAEAELNRLRAEVKATRDETKRHADDSREAGRIVQDAANNELTALQRVTDEGAQQTTEMTKRRGAINKVSAATQDFIARMQEQASKLASSNSRAATFASTAAALAKTLGRIPNAKEVNLTIKGIESSLYSLKGLRDMLLSIRDRQVRVSVIQSVGSINPVGRPAPGHHFEGGKITTPTAIVGEQAPTHPEWVIASNPAYRSRNQKLLGEAAKSMGGEVRFFAQGGVMSGGSSGFISGHAPGGRLNTLPGRLPPIGLGGVNQALSDASAYATGSGTASGAAAAAEYAAIPGKMAAFKAEIASLTRMIRGDDKFLLHEKDVVLALRRKMRAVNPKDPGAKQKRESLRVQIEDIIAHVVPGRKSARKGRVGKIKRDNAAIDNLVSLLGIVPGEDSFQTLIDTVEGEQSAASEVNRPDLADALKASEVADYRKRIAFLLAFTSQKSVQRDKNLWAAASSALKGRRGELAALTQVDDTAGGGGGTDTTGGGGTDAANADNQQALAMLAELANYARQGRLSDLIGDEELKTAMQFISAQVGSFAKGSPFIAKSGMAWVHQGEAIVPSADNQRNNKTGPLEGTITLEGSDELTRALANALGGKVNVQLGRDARRRQREGQR